VGRHRRVLMKDVLAHKQTMQVKSRAAMEDLVKLSEEMGTISDGALRSIHRRVGRVHHIPDATSS
jgi:hypothetical protein